MAKAKRINHYETDEIAQIHFFCPGCKQTHAISPTVHTFNGDYDKPTFTPSVLVTWGGQPNWICHSFVTDGRIQFLGDCSHELKNQTVELPEFKEHAGSN